MNYTSPSRLLLRHAATFSCKAVRPLELCTTSITMTRKSFGVLKSIPGFEYHRGSATQAMSDISASEVEGWQVLRTSLELMDGCSQTRVALPRIVHFRGRFLLHIFWIIGCSSSRRDASRRIARRRERNVNEYGQYLVSCRLRCARRHHSRRQTSQVVDWEVHFRRLRTQTISREIVTSTQW